MVKLKVLKPAMLLIERRMRSRLGGPQAITATAHKAVRPRWGFPSMGTRTKTIARIFYHLWKTGDAYIEPGVDAYEQKYRQRTLSYLEQKAQALGFDLVPHSSKSECVS
ncbi:hypothetical protein [Myxosarcina sp. GI1(2024)]